MSEAILLTLSDEVEAQVDALSSADGVSKTELVRRAVEAYVFIRQFRSLRREAMRQLDERGIRLTDEDIFSLVS
ncbi:MAG: ribbon-helix-helix protein, CopG family [Longimicrobiaceae bacterium]